MAVLTESRTALPAGTWALDPVHSTIGFELPYLAGTIAGPITDGFGNERVNLTLETAVDRTAFDLNWNMPLPNGQPALQNEVSLVAELYFVQGA